MHLYTCFTAQTALEESLQQLAPALQDEAWDLGGGDRQRCGGGEGRQRHLGGMAGPPGRSCSPPTAVYVILRRGCALLPQVAAQGQHRWDITGKSVPATGRGNSILAFIHDCTASQAPTLAHSTGERRDDLDDKVGLKSKHGLAWKEANISIKSTGVSKVSKVAGPANTQVVIKWC